MSHSLSSSDRSALIRIASSLPRGSGERRAILSGLRRQAGVNPHIDKGLLRRLESLISKAEGVASDFDDLAKVFDKAWGAYEDIYEKTHRDWVAKGNHPDDFNDPSLNPEGASMSRALQWYESMVQVLRGSSLDRDDISMAARRIPSELESWIRKAGR